MSQKTEIYVCFHNVNHIDEIKKNIKENNIYKPLFLGANKHDSEINAYKDNTGDNISNVNNNFSELTGLYWMWKNSKADIIGLVHYRRYFVTRKYFGKILSETDIKKDLENNDIILVKGTKLLEGNNYVSFRGWKKHLDMIWDSIKEVCPEYEDSFKKVMFSEQPISFFNMFIAPKDIIDGYCEWLFPLLFYTYEKHEKCKESRLMGCLSEFLINIYAYHHNLRIKEEEIKFTDKKIKRRMFILRLGINRFLYEKWFKFKNRNNEEYQNLVKKYKTIK